MPKKSRKAVKTAQPKQVRKNARTDDTVFIVPKAGIDGLLDRIGTFDPLDLRTLVKDAGTGNPRSVDSAVRSSIKDTTEKRIAELLERLGIHQRDPRKYQKGFRALAIAFCGIGQVVWKPMLRPNKSWASRDRERLCRLVRALCKRDDLSEREAIEKIGSDEFLAAMFPYHPHRKDEGRLKPEERRVGALRQTWMKIKLEERLSARRGLSPDDLIGSRVGSFEHQLLELDIKFAIPRGGKILTSKF
jgi:hypothetical protein